MGDDLLIRSRILDLVRSRPGIHFRELARRLETSVALIEYHIPILERQNLIVREVDGGYTRLFPPGEMSDLHKGYLSHLWEVNRAAILLALLEADGPLSNGQLAEALRTGKSRISFHCSKLEAAGLIEKDGREIRLTNPELVRSILGSTPPTPQLEDRFSQIWTDFYQG